MAKIEEVEDEFSLTELNLIVFHEYFCISKSQIQQMQLLNSPQTQKSSDSKPIYCPIIFHSQLTFKAPQKTHESKEIQISFKSNLPKK